MKNAWIELGKLFANVEFYEVMKKYNLEIGIQSGKSKYTHEIFEKLCNELSERGINTSNVKQLYVESEEEITPELAQFYFSGGRTGCNWGGQREGAGRPSTGRKKKMIYVTDDEYEKVKMHIETLRGETKMKKATLKHDDLNGFCLVGEDNFITYKIDIGEGEEPDWELIEKQANKISGRIAIIKENERKTEERINKEIDSCKMAYKVKDSEGNIFVYSCIENGFPVYRCNGGSKHIFDLSGLEIIEKYIKLTE